MRDGTELYIDPARRFYASFNDDGTVRLFNRRGRDQHGRWMPLATRWELRQKGLTAIGMSGPIEWLLWLQHRLGGPELHASAKAAFMARTAEVRTRARMDWTLRLLDDRFNVLNRELIDLWTAPGREAAARRELLFQRWDECDEAFGSSSEGERIAMAASAIDAARVETAEKARRLIESFIRRRLPHNSASEYTEAELSDMNRRRRSKQAFEPYKAR